MTETANPENLPPDDLSRRHRRRARLLGTSIAASAVGLAALAIAFGEWKTLLGDDRIAEISKADDPKAPKIPVTVSTASAKGVADALGAYSISAKRMRQENLAAEDIRFENVVARLIPAQDGATLSAAAENGTFNRIKRTLRLKRNASLQWGKNHKALFDEALIDGRRRQISLESTVRAEFPGGELVAGRLRVEGHGEHFTFSDRVRLTLFAPSSETQP